MVSPIIILFPFWLISFKDKTKLSPRPSPKRYAVINAKPLKTRIINIVLAKTSLDFLLEITYKFIESAYIIL